MSDPQLPHLTDFANVDITVTSIGKGGFGLVFMGPDRFSHGQWRALKTLRPELLAFRPALRDLFLRECLTWVGLWPHPNLLIAETATQIDGRLYLLLDYAEGGNLRDLLATDQPFRKRLLWAQHIAYGLQALHTPDPEFLRPFPLVHRDLKPENVLVHGLGHAMITDFGLAAAIGDALAQTPEAFGAQDGFALVEQLAAQATLATPLPTGGRAARATRTARFQARSAGVQTPGLGGVGTIAYMPPEQWDVEGNVGPPADLYAFGLILSELLAGRHGLIDLEADLDEDGWYQLHLLGAPRPLRTGPAESASRLPVDVEQLYQALLAKRPESRPTAAEALSVLRQAASQLGEEPYVWHELYLRNDEHRQMAWHNWSVTCLDFDLLEEALVRNKRALALDPRRSSTLNTQGNISARLGLRELEAGDTEQGVLHLEEALDWHSQAIAAATTNADRALAQGMKAARLNELGRYAEAEIAYAEALAIDADHGVTWQNRARNEWAWARAERDAGRRTEARRLYALALSHTQEALRRGPNDPETLRIFTSVQRERDRLDP